MLSQEGYILKDSFETTLPTDKNRRLIFCGFCVIIGCELRLMQKVKFK